MRVKDGVILLVLFVIAFLAMEALHLSAIPHEDLHDIRHHLHPRQNNEHAESTPVTLMSSAAPLSTKGISLVREERRLSYASQLAATQGSEQCEIPVLHPGKFQEKMGWGIRKNFTPCSPFAEAFSVAVERNGKDRSGWRVTVDKSHPACRDKIPVLYSFREMDDEQFTRLTSTLDAEFRQNDLQERYKLRLPAEREGGPAFADNRVDLDKSSTAEVDHPYVVAVCGAYAEVHVRAPRLTKRTNNPAAAPQSSLFPAKRIRNFLHVMFDSTSVRSLVRSASRTVAWLERMNNDARSPSAVFPFFHYHAVSCCSPGNQIPVYSGNMNGEGDRFVNAEPHGHSRDWIWNVASSLGYKTFWSLDNCPDKSARDYHAYPTVDSRVVAPLCLAGTILSHRDQSCVGRKTVDETVLSGLRSFLRDFNEEPKFAAVQFITPHEESEKLLLELDVLFEEFLVELENAGVLNDTALLFWSDHGINFGKYASTHDGEIEKMFPFVNFVLPKSFAEETSFGDHLWENRRKLTSPYDVYEATRAILYYPAATPPFSHDPSNPPLPHPRDSHIMASFQKDITPSNLATGRVDDARDCLAANIPFEFCTCIPFTTLPAISSDYKLFVKELAPVAISEHLTIVSRINAERPQTCKPVIPATVSVTSISLQVWPVAYKPKEQEEEKKVWMFPNRDVIKVQYSMDSGEQFQALFSISKSNRSVFDLSLLVRTDAMKSKCGITDKKEELLCVCTV
jgi:hypothetical protein